METSKLNAGIILIVYLYIHPGREVEFRQFETEAAQIMRKYGGHIDKVIRPTVSPPKEPLPHEIHIISFPSTERFEAYRGDLDLARLTLLRQSAIARTEIMIGEAGEPYLQATTN